MARLDQAAEQCEECSFDGDRWRDEDALSTLPIVAALWSEYLVDIAPELVQTRARAGEWSIAEYTDHVREVLFAMRFLLGTALAEPERDLGEAPTPRFSEQVRTIDIGRALAGVHEESNALARELGEIDPRDWGTGVVVDGERVDLRWIGRHAVHDVLHHLHDIARIRDRLGDGVARQQGTVEQVNVSRGGVPKLRIAEAEVDWAGVVGDGQHDRYHHGRPFQALSLWSGEVIDALVAEGHRVFPGAAGENLTVRGVQWDLLRPGALVRAGDVLAEVSSYATPCAKNAQWFVGGDYTRMDEDLHPGWGRLYARVLRTGRVRAGDPFEVEPD
jgi:MOSC domain-containing protein YiiM